MPVILHEIYITYKLWILSYHFYNPTFIIFLASRRELRKLQSHHSFKSFVIKHKRNYENLEEYQKRFGIFKENMKKVQFLRETEKGSAEYGPTQFSDLTEQEFKVLRLIQKKWDEQCIPNTLF